MLQYTPLPQARAVLEFWFGDALELGWPSQPRGELWFGGGSAVDSEINARFGQLVNAAVDGALADWEMLAVNRLALVILLDQFTRNVFRGQARAFAGDGRAQTLVADGAIPDWPARLPLAGQVFLTMPLVHAETMTLQDEGVRRLEALLASAAPARSKDLQAHLDSAREHRAIIAAFGRFPHRNATLGRADTPQEQAFMKQGPRFGQ